MSKPKKRLNLVLSASVHERLLRVKEEMEADTMAEVFRRSLALMDAMMGLEAEGSSFILEEEGGKRTRMSFGFNRKKA